MRGGIYCIENLKNGKKYIGQSVDLEKRKHEHFKMLKGNYHFNIHLQNAFNKYEENNFKFKILLYCESFELTKYEQFFVDFYTPKILYNICTECVNSVLGTTRSEKTRKKMSKAQSGENNPMYGKYLSKETKEKISNALSGENNPNYGKHYSEETRKKMSDERCGEKGNNSKLMENQVFEILDLYYNKDKTQTDIAKIFPVTSMATSYIVRGKTWKNCYKKFMENNKK